MKSSGPPLIRAEEPAVLHATIALPNRQCLASRSRACLASVLLTAFGFGCATTTTPSTASERPAELAIDPMRVETLGAPNAHWVWVHSALAPTARLFDASTGQMLGLLSTSHSTNAVETALSSSEVINAAAYYSRGTYGDRTDVVQIRSLSTLLPVGEVVLPEGPPKLANGFPLRGYSGLLDGDRWFVVYNFNPAMSVSVVDVPGRRYAGDIQTAGCGLVFPVTSDAFLQLCGDGSVQRVRLDTSGNEADRASTATFFDANNDPLMDRPARDGARWWFTTMNGQIYSVNASLEVSTPFAVQGAGERSWRPGGRLPLAYHRATSRLFVLMHEGGIDTHEHDGTEVWVFDTRTATRVARYRLAAPTNSIAVTQDSATLLYALDAATYQLVVYNANDGSKIREIDTSAIGASVIQPIDTNR